MTSTKVELNCDMTCGRCKDKIEKTLKDVSGLKVIDNVKSVQGRCTFRCYVNDCNLVDMIGRSMVLTEQETNNHLGAGTMARSSPIFGNVKKVCECSGKTLWDEREERQKK
ncbi:uncharacterized protein LOC141857471 [Brevipalpus obovatus]|uniref:uncharacterized protein LOC141857471 n=1 Tax=Brevipalpus obovatus TaxID=246614 RepID=UPI003D9F66E3